MHVDVVNSIVRSAPADSDCRVRVSTALSARAAKSDNQTSNGAM
jgi:hypothetical protein